MTTPTIFFEDIVLDVTDIVATVTADRDEMVAYGKQFDPWPMQVDDEAGRATPFGGLIASGGYTIGLWYRAGHLDQTEGELAFLGGVEWRCGSSSPSARAMFCGCTTPRSRSG
jgi:acyl dehydratase